MKLDLAKRYVITDVHPADFFYPWRDDLIGQIVTFAAAKNNAFAGEGFIFGEAVFETHVITEDLIFDDVTFYGLKVSEHEYQ